MVHVRLGLARRLLLAAPLGIRLVEGLRPAVELFSDAALEASDTGPKSAPVPPHAGLLLSDNCYAAHQAEQKLHQMTWDMIGEERRKAYETIGYDESIWNDYARTKDDQTDWDDLSEGHRQTLSKIGYTKMLWDCDVAGETAFPNMMPPVEGRLHVNQAMIKGGQTLVLESGKNTLVIGVFHQVISAIIGSAVGRLLAGMYGLHVEFRTIDSKVNGQQLALLKKGEIDLIMDSEPTSDQAAQLGSDVYRYSAVTELGNMYHLYVNTPKNTTLPYFDALTEVTPSWMALQRKDIQGWLPHRSCTMGPWSTDTSGYGVWCMNRGQRVPVIWALGPQLPRDDVQSLMAFIHAKDLPFGIEFLDSNELDRRVILASEAGAPAAFYLEEMSQTAFGAEKNDIRRLMMPEERECGELGNWTHVGKWQCVLRRVQLDALGGKEIDTAENVRRAVDNFRLSDTVLRTMVAVYRESYAKEKDVFAAISAAAEHFVQSESELWRTWFTFPEPMSTDGRGLILGFVGVSLLLFLAVEFKSPRPEAPPDTVDRRKPTAIGLELLAGTNSTLSAMMDGVGIAAIVLSTQRLRPYSMEFLKHVLVGQLVVQTFTCLGSNYETPVCTSSIEMLPFLSILVVGIEESTKGKSGECVIATLLVGSSLICLLSGLMMYTIGKLKLGSMLRYLPYSVKTGVQAGMGIVLLEVALELCCDENFLEFENAGAVADFFRPSTSLLWLPAFVGAVVIFCVEKFVCESPYTIICFLVLAIGGFHVLRVLAFNVSLRDAAEAGWLYESTDAGATELLSLWRLLRLENICWSALVDNAPTMLIAALVAPILNNVGDLAVVRSVLPPKDMGDSDFNDELAVQGRSHVLSAVCCGFSSDYGNDDTIVHRMFGGKRRLSMYVHCGTLFFCLVCPFVAELLTFTPKFANGGPIALAGLEFMYEALVESRAQMRTSEYLVVVVFALIVLVTGGAIEQAIIIGTFLGFADFVVRYAKAGQTKFVTSKSMTMWRPEDFFRLEFCGLRSTIASARLSGYIFFASGVQVVDQLLEKVKQMREVPLPHRKVLIVDWARVSGMDTGAAVEFERLEEELSKAGVAVIFCGLAPKIVKTFERCEIEFVKEDDEKAVRRSSRRASGQAEDDVQDLSADGATKQDGHQEEEDEEEDSEDDEPTIVLLGDMDQALHRAEVMQLRGLARPIEEDATAERFGAAARFRALAAALRGRSPLCRALRRLVAADEGGVQLAAASDGEEIVRPGARTDSFCVLAAGCVVAFTEDHPGVLRHVQSGHIFAGEACLGDRTCPISKMGYRAAPSCVVLKVRPDKLEPEEQTAVFRMIVDQMVQIKGMLGGPS